jgi:tRNA(fMet)-specific endonuclease VapC
VTARFLLDTNIVSEPLRLRPNAHVLKHLQLHQGELAIAATTWHELWFGCQRLPASAKRAIIEDYLNELVALSLPVLPYDERAAEWHASVRARLVAAGKTPGFADGQIAAVAVTNALTLVTLNVVDYGEFTELSLADWTK